VPRAELRPIDDARSQALDAFLSRREAEGYRIETRSGMQAVIYRRRRRHFVLRLVARGNTQRRLLVSVDRQAHITSVAVEPVA
jgi:hypothetical protein